MLSQKLTIFLFLLVLFLPLSQVLASTILSGHKYAWSDNVGYINFENVVVGDNALSGYAWSANKGLINFSPTKGGVLNDGTGNLSGSAWGDQLGWIDFNNVSIGANGQFSGTATGQLVGTITFDCPNYCDVNTDWRPAPLPATPPPAGGGGGSGGGGGNSVIVGPAQLAVGLPNAGSSPVDPTFAEIAAAAPKGSAPYRADPVADNSIDILDFNLLMVKWGQAFGSPLTRGCNDKMPADINCDSKVNILDFNLLMVYWGKPVNKH